MGPPKRPSLKVVLTSGLTDEVACAQKSGSADPELSILPKPYRLADLSKVLQEALDKA
jgi:hypothetical protein